MLLLSKTGSFEPTLVSRDTRALSHIERGLTLELRGPGPAGKGPFERLVRHRH